MNRFFAAFALASALASCSGGGGDAITSDDSVGIGTCTQPLVADTDETCPETTDTATTPEDPDIYATGGEYVVTDMSYDPATDQVVFDNVPFDGDDNVYTRNAAVTGSDFDNASAFAAYNNASGSRRYFAVFRRSPDDYSQVGALGSNSYITFGYGGAAAQRISGDGSLPDANQSYVFTGEYAAVRTIQDENKNTAIQYVAGTVNLDVDIQDFNDTGAVGGIIANRQYFDQNGTRVFTTSQGEEFISLTDAEIDFTDWSITSATATHVMENATDAETTVSGGNVSFTPLDPTNLPTGAQQTASGTWEGIFAGPNGEEVAGVVLLEGTGPVGIDRANGNILLTEGTIRETGVFQAKR